jgi:hypothetical protein
MEVGPRANNRRTRSLLSACYFIDRCHAVSASYERASLWIAQGREHEGDKNLQTPWKQTRENRKLYFQDDYSQHKTEEILQRSNYFIWLGKKSEATPALFIFRERSTGRRQLGPCGIMGITWWVCSVRWSCLSSAAQPRQNLQASNFFSWSCDRGSKITISLRWFNSSGLKCFLTWLHTCKPHEIQHHIPDQGNFKNDTAMVVLEGILNWFVAPAWRAHMRTSWSSCPASHAGPRNTISIRTIKATNTTEHGESPLLHWAQLLHRT